jgi:hypothetical protein
MNRAPDDDLRELFDEARRADEQKAPPFRRILQSRAPAAFAPSRRIARALAVAAAATAVVILARSPRRPPGAPPDHIESWKAPTDFLLGASFTALFDTVPNLTPPVPDYSPLLEEEKGSTS